MGQDAQITTHRDQIVFQANKGNQVLCSHLIVNVMEVVIKVSAILIEYHESMIGINF